MPKTCWDVLMSTTVPTGVVPVEPEESPEGEKGTVAPVDGIVGAAVPPTAADREEASHERE